MQYIVAVIRDIKDFAEGSMQVVPTGEDGVQVMRGVLSADSIHPEAAPFVHAYLFSPDYYDDTTAQTYLRERGMEAVSMEIQEVDLPEDGEEMPTEEAPMPEGDEMPEEAPAEPSDEMPAPPADGEDMEAPGGMPTDEEDEDEEMRKEKRGKRPMGYAKEDDYALQDVEIFQSGTWNGNTYTDSDLDDMVEAFEATKEVLKPYMKLGHDNGQKLVQKDGYPSAGWITSLKRSGNKLLATIKAIPSSIGELIKKQRYGRFSAEIYHNVEVGGKNFRRAVKAVALLGADTPAVGTTKDLVNVYENLKFDKVDTCITQDASEEEMQFKEQAEALATENKVLRDRMSRIENDSKQAKVQQFIDEQMALGKIVPAQAELYTALLMSEGVHKFSKLDDDNKLQTEDLSTFGIVSKIIEAGSPAVDFSVKSGNQKPSVKHEDDKLDDQIREYMKENKVSYGEAYDAVSQEVK